MTSTLALLVVVAELVAQPAAIMKPPLTSSGAAGEQPALVAGASGASRQAWHRTCPLADDSLQLTAAESLGPGQALDQQSLAHDPAVRSCLLGSVTDLKPFLLPEYKLAFCPVAKAACTQFKDLFGEINGVPEVFRGYAVGNWQSTAGVLGLNESDITRENGWKFAAFTRDPALRYFSAFGDVCQAGAFGGLGDELVTARCCGPPVDMLSASHDEMVRDFKARVQYDVKAGRPVNQHWQSQAELLAHCGWDKFKPESLDYWGTLSGDVNAQVTEMLQAVGYNDSRVVDVFFPPDHVAGHTSKLDADPLDFFDDLETLEGIVKVYAEDYRLLPDVGCSFTEPLLAKLKAANASSH